MQFGRKRKKAAASWKKNAPPEIKNAPVGLDNPHSKGCWVFVYTGRGQSSFRGVFTRLFNGYFEKPVQLLEHPRFYSGVDVWPLVFTD